MPKVNFNTKLLLAALIVATVILDVAFGWMIWMTFAFFGVMLDTFVVAAVLVFPPLAATLYCVNRALAVRKGENPRF